jgi:hypothetical protein
MAQTTAEVDAMIEDTMFLWDNGERDIEKIADRLGVRRTAITDGFKRRGYTRPWVGEKRNW